MSKVHSVTSANETTPSPDSHVIPIPPSAPFTPAVHSISDGPGGGHVHLLPRPTTSGAVQTTHAPVDGLAWPRTVASSRPLCANPALLPQILLPRSSPAATRQSEKRQTQIARGDVVGLLVVGARPGAYLALHLLRHRHRGMVSQRAPPHPISLDLPLRQVLLAPACLSLSLLFASALYLQGYLHHGEQPHRGRHQGAQDHI